MDNNRSIVIVPTEVESWISGVSRVERAPDQTVSLVYSDHSRVSAQLEPWFDTVHSNFLALVRRVQNAARAGGQPLPGARLV